MDDLRCPFCGGWSSVRLEWSVGVTYSFKDQMVAYCTSCYARGPDVHCGTGAGKREKGLAERKAIKLWNKRTKSKKIR